MAVFIGTNGADTLIGTSGNDIISAGNGDDHVDGGNGNDILAGNAGDDSLAGGNGNDILTGGDGDDAIDGGSGTDTAIYLRQLSSHLFVRLSDGAIRVTDIVSGDIDVVRNVELFVFTDVVRTADELPFSAVLTANGQGGVDIELSNAAVLDGSLGTNGVDTVIYGGVSDIVLPDTIENVTLTGNTNVSVTGNSADNTLIGNTGNNTIAGGDGNDFIDGGAGDDTYIGGNGIDTAGYALDTLGVTVDLVAGIATGAEIGTDTLVSIENVEGGLGNDIIRGDAGANRLLGGDGDDRLAGRGGDDFLDGGNGSDTAGYALDTQGVNVDLVLGTASGAEAGNDTLVSIENVEGGLGDDVIRGDAGANRLLGGDGDDRLAGRGGADFLDGGNGNDTAGYALDTLGVNVDLVLGTASGAAAGNDTLVSIENVEGGLGNDIIRGDAGANRLLGGDGDDRLAGRGGDDFLDGGNGSDTAAYALTTLGVTVDLVAGIATGAEIGTDTLVSIESVEGGLGSDIIRGDAGANRLLGGDGDDRLAGRGGDDFLDGGNGNDTAGYALDTLGVNVDLVLGTASGAEAGNDTLVSIENVEGGLGNDIIRGDAGANRLLGGDGDDRLAGRGGDDFLDGGNGSDTAAYALTTLGVTVDLVAGIATGAEIGTDTLVSIENVEGGLGSDIIRGDAGANRLLGGDGDDRLAGRGGDDFLDGGNGIDTAGYALDTLGVTVDLVAGIASGAAAGNDTLVSIENVEGGLGNDIIRGDAGANRLLGGDGDDRLAGRGGDDFLDGGNGSDTAAYALTTQGVTVDLVAGTASGAAAGIDTLVSIENVEGGLGNDIIRGDAGANRLLGGDGDDRLAGRGGDDFLDGGNGIDTAAYALTTLGVTVDLVAGIATGAEIGTDTLVSIENVEGGLGNDIIRGDAGANRLLGGDGDDRLAGRGGNDFLDGGSGSDTAGYAQDTQGVTVDLVAGTASGAAAGNDTLVSIENVEGGLGNDIIRGDAGANRLLGGDGDDRLAGRGGNDFLDGGSGSDTAGYAQDTQGVTVDLVAGTASGAAAGIDTLVSIENVEGGLATA